MREAASFIADQSASTPASLLNGLATDLISALRKWQNRRKLVSLVDLDDHLLADVGVTREDVRWALDLPFGYDAAAALQRRAWRNQEIGWRSE